MNDLTKVMIALGYPTEVINELEKETWFNCGITLRFDEDGNLICCKGEDNTTYLEKR